MTLARAIAAGSAPCLRPILVAAVLMLATVLHPAIVRADAGHEHEDMNGEGVVFGLTGTQLALAAAVGAALGGTAAFVARGVSVGAGAGAGIGVLTLIYLGHIAAEILVVGGVYMLWPESPPEEPHGTIGPISVGATRISGLSLAASTRQP